MPRHLTQHRTVTAGLWLFLGSWVASCAPASTAAFEPAAIPPQSRLVSLGEIAAERHRAQLAEFDLADGTRLSFDLHATRVIVRGGGRPALLVAGRDDAGEWLAILGHQDGTPDGCHVLNQTGHELGSSIAIAGARWTKAPGLASAGGPPPLGAAYPPGTRFCLDGSARVNAILAD